MLFKLYFNRLNRICYVFLVCLEIKNKTDLAATYSKAHSPTIKFATLEISTQWGGGFTHAPYNNDHVYVYNSFSKT